MPLPVGGGDVAEQTNQEDPWGEPLGGSPRTTTSLGTCKARQHSPPDAAGRGDAVIPSSSDSPILKCELQCKKTTFPSFPCSPGE